jgi:hypothetical protein
MNRRLLPILGVAALAAALGCAELSEPLVIGEGYSDAPSPLPFLGKDFDDDAPTGKGGGPLDKSDKCHDPDLDLDDVEQVPEGFEEGDDSEFSPAHPPHLRGEKRRGFEERI